MFVFAPNIHPLDVLCTLNTTTPPSLVAPTVAMLSSCHDHNSELSTGKTQEAIKTPEDSSPGVDQAWEFLNHHRDAATEYAPVDIAALRRRIDYRVVPLMFCCYTMQFLDKVILNVRTLWIDCWAPQRGSLSRSCYSY